MGLQDFIIEKTSNKTKKDVVVKPISEIKPKVENQESLVVRNEKTNEKANEKIHDEVKIIQENNITKT
jgi:hypothetical protein